MSEKLSIFEGEKFASCRLCDGPVSSYHPTCKNCGLEMSSEGVAELAEIEELEIEQKSNEFTEIYSLRVLSISSLFSNLIGYVYHFLGVVILFKLFFWISFLILVAGFFYWNLKFVKKEFSPEEKEEVRKEQLISAFIFLVSMAIGITTYIFS